MDRRRFVAAAAGALLAETSSAVPAAARDFDAAVAGRALHAPFKGVDDAGGSLDGTARLLGRWPAGLRGRFYRNGPALFERNGQRYHHWFDGDGMVQQFSIGEGRVVHRGRLVHTDKLLAERRAGRFLRTTLGTDIEGGLIGGGPDVFNTANTNALEHAGRVLALWEGGSAHALTVDGLATEGPVTWRDDLRQAPFSAHPKVDAAGHLWNFGAFGEHIVVWHIDATGRLVKVQVGRSPYPGGMVHDMAVTPRWIVLPLPPIKFNFEQRVTEGPRRFALDPGEPLRVLVMAKDDIAERRVFELPAEMVFHVANAHETRDGRIVLGYIGAPDAWSLDRAAVANLAAHPERGAHAVTLRLATLDTVSGRVQQRAQGAGNAEFPRVAPQRLGLDARWLLTAGGWRPGADTQGALRHGVELHDLHDLGRVRRFDYGPDQVAEEHVFVPRPGRAGTGNELDAWLLGTTYDARRRATVLNLLDAAHIEDGPVAQAVLPYMLPLGFHGNFTPA
jgi:carotenoid cleavage dioxygenase